jgi:hypothetical protein
VANFGTTVVTESSNLARYIGRIVGTVPEDVVGLFLGDPLHAVRTLAAQWYDDKIREIHARRNVKRLEAVSLSVAIPLLRGAYDENREQLRELWAALIAAATDQERTGRVRLSFIGCTETIRSARRTHPEGAIRYLRCSFADRHYVPASSAWHFRRGHRDIR